MMNYLLTGVVATVLSAGGLASLIAFIVGRRNERREREARATEIRAGFHASFADALSTENARLRAAMNQPEGMLKLQEAPDAEDSKPPSIPLPRYEKCPHTEISEVFSDQVLSWPILRFCSDCGVDLSTLPGRECLHINVNEGYQCVDCGERLSSDY